MILGYTLISTCFQSPIHVIKAKYPWLERIDVVVEGFLTGPPLKGTQTIELPVHQVANLIQAKEETIPFEEGLEVAIQEPSFLLTLKRISSFSIYRTQPSTLRPIPDSKP